MMRRSLMITPVLAIALGGHAMAQQASNTRYYLDLFKYSDNAIKAMIENPQDRSAAARKLAEGFGGKLVNIFWYATSGKWDGFAIFEFPDDVTAEAVLMTGRATGNFRKNEIIPLVTAEQFKAAMEKAQQTKSGYTPPTMTR
jgi:uncharacterized protein with GYD domain